MAHLYLLTVECPWCAQISRFGQRTELEIGLMRDVRIDEEYCSHCSEHVLGWDVHEEAKVTRVRQ